jgi:hypothetical protein
VALTELQKGRSMQAMTCGPGERPILISTDLSMIWRQRREDGSPRPRLLTVRGWDARSARTDPGSGQSRK